MTYNKSFKNAGENSPCSVAAKGAAPFNLNVRVNKTWKEKPESHCFH